MIVLKCEMCGANISPRIGIVFATCDFCGTVVIIGKSDLDATHPLTQTVFARWKKKYYYPATIVEDYENHSKVLYLDGDVATVLKEHIISLEEAFSTLQFQGNWKQMGLFYKGRITNF